MSQPVLPHLKSHCIQRYPLDRLNTRAHDSSTTGYESWFPALWCSIILSKVTCTLMGEIAAIQNGGKVMVVQQGKIT